jgi:hypothetical protein
MIVYRKMSSPSEAQTPDIQLQPQQTPESNAGGASIFFIGFVLFWLLGSVGALIMSLVCFGLSGSTMEKVIGLAIAFFLGPLYFIFYGFNKGYCRNLGANVVRSVNTYV